MDRQFDIAVVGATGLVGEALIEMLEQREFPVGQVYLLASDNSAGKHLQFNDKSVRVELLDEFDFSQAEIAFFVAGEAVSEEYAQQAADQGCIVIDNSHFFTSEYDVPLVIPEVNPEQLAEFRNRGIIATPGSLTITMLLALAPLHRHASVKRINAVSYQAVSSAGKKGVEALAGETAKLLNAQTPESHYFNKQIAFNTVPLVGEVEENGYSSDENRLMDETRKILGEGVMVNPSSVQVPVFFGHGIALHVECWDPISAAEVEEMITYAEGVELTDGDDRLDVATPVAEAAKNDEVFVSRVREDISCENAINLWVVADNVRKGSALNMIQVAEALVQSHL